mgnify:CR=1 FL=1
MVDLWHLSFGLLGSIATLVGLYFSWCRWRKRRRSEVPTYDIDIPAAVDALSARLNPPEVKPVFLFRYRGKRARFSICINDMKMTRKSGHIISRNVVAKFKRYSQISHLSVGQIVTLSGLVGSIIDHTAILDSCAIEDEGPSPARPTPPPPTRNLKTTVGEMPATRNVGPIDLRDSTPVKSKSSHRRRPR